MITHAGCPVVTNVRGVRPVCQDHRVPVVPPDLVRYKAVVPPDLVQYEAVVPPDLVRYKAGRPRHDSREGEGGTWPTLNPGLLLSARSREVPCTHAPAYFYPTACVLQPRPQPLQLDGPPWRAKHPHVHHAVT